MQLALIIRSIGHNDPRCCSLPAQNSAQQTCVHRKDYSAIVAPTPQVIDNADATSAKALRKRKSPSACMLPRQLFDGPWPIFRHHRLTLCISCLWIWVLECSIRTPIGTSNASTQSRCP